MLRKILDTYEKAQEIARMLFIEDDYSDESISPPDSPRVTLAGREAIAELDELQQELARIKLRQTIEAMLYDDDDASDEDEYLVPLEEDFFQQPLKHTVYVEKIPNTEEELSPG